MDDVQPPIEGIPSVDWEATPASVRAVLLLLLGQSIQLTSRVHELEQRLAQTSQNSSKPPSSDPPTAPPRPRKTPRGRKAGAQQGHQGATRERREPDLIVPCRPTSCPHCQTSLAPDLPDAVPPSVTQVWELPPIRPLITDYQHHTVCCPQCAAPVTAPALPEASSGYGPRLTALIGHLHGSYHLSYRAIACLLADVADLPIGLGSVVSSTERVSAALAPIDAAIHAALGNQASLNVDETSWRESGKRCWLWTARSASLTCFRITSSRGRSGLDKLLAASYGGVICSDRWSVYNRYADTNRQLCWAHLKRNLLSLAEGGMTDSLWARSLLTQVDGLFAAWHAFGNGTTDRASLQRRLEPIQQAMLAALKQGKQLQWHKIVGLGTELEAHWQALWTFARVEGVEPTNNAAERALRPAVIWRKQCFGTQSAAGSRFVERILSVVTTCRQQARNVWSFLSDAVAAARAGLPAPQLLSTP